MNPPCRLAAFAALAAALLAAHEARADADLTIEQGAIDFETGKYGDCILRFQGVLKQGSIDEATTQDQRNRARMYLGACLMAAKREADADAMFEQLILDDYRYSPDRASFPNSVIGRFSSARLRLRDKIEAKVRADQEREAEERRKKEEHDRLEKLRQQTIELMAREQTSVQHNSRLVALIPFGVGQLQNRQQTLGWTLLGAQAVLGAASVVTFLLKQDIERQFGPAVDPTEAKRRRDLAAQVNYISFGAFAALALGGIVHAQITFVPEFRETRDRPLPAPIPPLAAPTGGMLLWQGKF